METTGELRQGELARRIEDYRTAYQDRDVERMLTLFADDAELTAAPGTFRGKAAIRKFFEWDARISPAATIRDTGLGVLVVGRSVVWEREVTTTSSASWRRSPRGCPASMAGSPESSWAISSLWVGRVWTLLRLDRYGPRAAGCQRRLSASGRLRRARGTRTPAL